MKAAIVERPGVLKVKDVPEPEVKDYDLLIKVQTASICNATDNHILNGTFKGDHDRYPQILGHEAHGEVVACGKKVANAPLGKRIVAYIPMGAFCEYTTLDTTRLPYALIPDSLSPLESPLCEMFHGALLHTVYPSGIKDGERAVVIGQGPMGLVVSQCLKVMADCTLAAIDFQEFRLAKAQALGVDRVYNRSELNESEIESRLKAEIGEPDLAIVCIDDDLSDTVEAYEFAIRLLKSRGRLTGLTVAAKGITQRVDVGQIYAKHIHFKRRLFEIYSVDPAEKLAREKEIFQTGVNWVTEGKIDMRGLVTHCIPLEDIAHGLFLCRERPGETIKIVVNIASSVQV
jgi:threonine dehydrogenase-like Zn-dependent dehydrogenase